MMMTMMFIVSSFIYIHIYIHYIQGNAAGGAAKTSIEQMMESLDGGGGVDSVGGMAVVRPGDASK